MLLARVSGEQVLKNRQKSSMTSSTLTVVPQITAFPGRLRSGCGCRLGLFLCIFLGRRADDRPLSNADDMPPRSKPRPPRGTGALRL